MATKVNKPKTGDFFQISLDPFSGTAICLNFTAAKAVVVDAESKVINLYVAYTNLVSDSEIKYWEADSAKSPDLDKPVYAFLTIHGKEWTKEVWDREAKRFDPAKAQQITPSDYELFVYQQLEALATADTPFSGKLVTGMDSEKFAMKANDPDYSDSAKAGSLKALAALLELVTEPGKVNADHLAKLISLKQPTPYTAGGGGKGNYKAKSKEEELTEVTNWLHKTLVEDTNGQKAKLIDIGLALYDDGTEDGNNSNVIITPAVAIRTALELIFGMHKIV